MAPLSLPPEVRPTGCPDADKILSFLEQGGDAQVREALVDHFDGCAACRAMLVGLARATMADDQRPGGGEAGGRYVLLSVLGGGAMGVVHAAFDRQLDRKVALKFLSSVPHEDAARARARLQREAQALAKLAHPNVVVVHDVGVLDDEVYVAMELVQGGTLRGWLASRTRTVREVLAVMQQAGEGLAAAHAAGLVHRDFKPDNVLVGDDGRVRVTDFGLARSADAGGLEVGPHADDGVRVATLTQTGVRAGTPAYMAPEQNAGEPPSPRSDVYSFSVTLHEALTGGRLGDPILRRIPAWLERAVERGLRARPADRWPTMRALLDVLARGPLVTARRAILVLAALLVGAFAIVAQRSRVSAAERLTPCPAPIHALDAVWGDAQRVAVKHSVERAGGGTEALAHVMRRLDDYRATWVKAEVDTCEATRVRAEQSEPLMDVRMTCLEDRKGSLGRTVSLLASAEADVAGRAVEIVDGMPRIATCASIRSLLEVVPPPDAARGAIAEAKASLDDARGLFLAGRVTEGHDRLAPAIAAMTRLGYAPLLAQLLYWRGQMERDLDLSDACGATLVAAAEAAIDARDDRTLAQAWTLLAREMSDLPGRRDAQAWVVQAGAAIRRLGGDDELEGERQLGLASVVRDRRDSSAALLRGRELLVKTHDEDYYLVASIDQRIGNLAAEDHRMSDAVAYHARSLALRMRLFGVDHPSTVSSLFCVAEDEIEEGRPTEAREALRTLDALIDHRPAQERAWYDIVIGNIERLEGRWSAALEHHRAADAIYESVRHDEPVRGVALLQVGRDLLDLARPREAITPLEASLTYSAPLGDAAIADARFELGRAYFGAGEPTRGRALVLKAKATYESHPDATDSVMHDTVLAWLASHG